MDIEEREQHNFCMRNENYVKLIDRKKDLEKEREEIEKELEKMRGKILVKINGFGYG